MLDYAENYTHATLCFPINGDEVLLAEKQRKIGAGYLNGFGGRIEGVDDDIEDTNIRETEEEIGIRIKIAKKMGEIVFHNPSDYSELRKMVVHIFTANDWDGEPKETDEMKNIAWYKIADLDYDKFLPADRLFMPQILSGKCVKGLIEYNDDWSVKTCEIDEVEGF
ncbi:MAG: NUDIX domain-containing protein [Candidatus Saccharimonadaceae bacterium]|nr:NUDIX domain-containing protein [Candidatus Saccharimonadaceae bacterium]